MQRNVEADVKAKHCDDRFLMKRCDHCAYNTAFIRVFRRLFSMISFYERILSFFSALVRLLQTIQIFH